ncbi:MAG: hypothetical protein PHD55_06635 [Methanoregula sp.]|nr:hypothetical protein [Methanoregula sp.]
MDAGAMDDHAAYKNLEDRIGYRFHDAVILESALASRAAHAGNPSQTIACTVPLAAVGDAVIDAVVACRLYEEWQESGPVPPGDAVKQEWIRSFAEQDQISRHVRSLREQSLEDIWRTGKRPPDMVTEAVIGAVFVDAERYGKNGLAAVRAVLTGCGNP